MTTPNWALALTLVASLAHADIPVNDTPLARPDVSCVGRPEGAACAGGRCQKRVVRRPDFSKGGLPVWTDVEVMFCDRSQLASLSALLVLLLGAALFLGARWLARPGPRAPPKTGLASRRANP